VVLSATLDSITNQCFEILTDGEETQKQIPYRRRIHSSVALIYHAIKGKSKRKALLDG